VRFQHTACGGDIDTKTKTCTRCKKHWNWFTWWMTATEIRPVPERTRPGTLKVAGRKKPIRVQYASWGDRLPGVGAIAGRLPNWPRWARIVSTLVVIGIVVVIVLLVRC